MLESLQRRERRPGELRSAIVRRADDALAATAGALSGRLMR
jgi:hypothetical protein